MVCTWAAVSVRPWEDAGEEAQVPADSSTRAMWAGDWMGPELCRPTASRPKSTGAAGLEEACSTASCTEHCKGLSLYSSCCYMLEI